MNDGPARAVAEADALERDLGTTFGARLLGIGYGFGGLRGGMDAARRIAIALDEAELTTHSAQPARSAASGEVSFESVSFG